MRRFEQLSEVAACVGQDVAVSDWVLVDHAMINTFADATGDHQWIHVDPVRAAKGPFGAPVAHGFLTLSLLPKFFDTTFDIAASSMGVNYGLNRVRFMSPVPVNSRVRGHMHLLASEPVAGDGLQLTWRVTVEIQGVDKPACVAESVVRRYP
jgi:acyl dehydratase